MLSALVALTLAITAIWAPAAEELLRDPSGGSGSPPLVQCASNGTTPAGSWQVTAPGPAGTVSNGTILGVAYAVRLGGGPSTAAQLEVPTVVAQLQTTSGSISVVFPPTSLAVTDGTWSEVVRNRTLGTTTFLAGSSTTFSTELLATQVQAQTGTVPIEVRAGWGLSAGYGPSTGVNWTPAPGPTIQAQPFVALRDHSPSPAPEGTTFTVDLAGGPSGATYELKLENSTSGRTLVVAKFLAPATPSPEFQGAVLLDGSANGSAVGADLVHLHGPCGGILYSIPVTVVPPTPLALELRAS